MKGRVRISKGSNNKHPGDKVIIVLKPGQRLALMKIHQVFSTPFPCPDNSRLQDVFTQGGCHCRKLRYGLWRR
ncbi:hypothetical protein RRG08_014265 [Elysia crispata]|uniref:Uncharacterized protein n=1 Tax=Elysia crispata TaxID=231223 RepID=A0AAE1B712_9GAST|nr:hypothetical protein RRG08_014265 [Elysia crispata]